MKIMIMKCDDKNLWYKDNIGKTFTVKGDEKDKYYVQQKASLASVLKSDAEVIEK